MGADAKGVGPARSQQGVYLPVGEHGAEGLALADELQVYIRVCVGLHVQHVPWSWSVVATLEPMNGLQVDAVLVLEDALDPNGRCLPEFGNSHALACQVLRDAYAGVGVDEHEGVAENPRGKGGYGHKWELAPGPQAHVQGQEHLRDIELSVFDHPVHQNGWRLDSHIGEVDAVWLDDAVAQGFSAVVRTAAESQREVCHCHPLARHRLVELFDGIEGGVASFEPRSALLIGLGPNHPSSLLASTTVSLHVSVSRYCQTCRTQYHRI